MIRQGDRAQTNCRKSETLPRPGGEDPGGAGPGVGPGGDPHVCGAVYVGEYCEGDHECLY